MVENNELQIGIGNEEAVTLKPTIVKILSITTEEVGKTKKGKKAVFSCKHPESQEPIKISAIKWEFKGKLETTGTWINLDSKGLIRKGSGLAHLMQYFGVQNLNQLVNKEIPTTTDDKSYLVFKAY